MIQLSLTGTSLDFAPVRAGRIVRCAWCGKAKAPDYIPQRWADEYLDLAESQGVKVSHGICPACMEKETA